MAEADVRRMKLPFRGCNRLSFKLQEQVNGKEGVQQSARQHRNCRPGGDVCRYFDKCTCRRILAAKNQVFFPGQAAKNNDGCIQKPNKVEQKHGIEDELGHYIKGAGRLLRCVRSLIRLLLMVKLNLRHDGTGMAIELIIKWVWCVLSLHSRRRDRF